MLQLALSLACSWILFHAHEIGVALADMILLWAVVGLTTLVFDRVASSTAWPCCPYRAWLTSGAFLKIEFWRLNT